MDVMTIAGMEGLLKKRLAKNHILSKEERESANALIKTKQDFIKSKSNPGHHTKVVEEAKSQLSQALAINNFLQKESLDSYGLPPKIHPAGDLKAGFVIEPVERNLFAYNWCGMKGLAQVQIYPDSKKEYLVIEEQEILLAQKPISEFAFDLPDIGLIRKWEKNRVPNPPLNEIWFDLQRYFRLFLDLQSECFYDALCLFTLQSWLSSSLNSVFYLIIFGSWGAGKTCVAKGVEEVCRHGHQGSPSPAFIARVLDRQKITLFVDELDSISKSSEDSELLSIVRQGYRKGAKFSRINKETMDPEFFDIYGPKIITIHSIAEEALQQRGIPIMTTESTDKTTPVINQIRRKYSKDIVDKLFIWYMNNVIMVDLVDLVDNISDRGLNNITRKILYERLCMSLERGQLEYLGQLKGRNAELGFSIAQISGLLNLENPESDGNPESNSKINLSQSFKDIFESKKQIEEERLEIGPIGLVREILVRLWKDKKNDKNHITDLGHVKIENKLCYSAVNEELKKNKGMGMGPPTFAKCIRELGFEAPNNRKKMKVPDDRGETTVRLCNIFDVVALRKLGLPIDSLITKEEKVE